MSPTPQLHPRQSVPPSRSPSDQQQITPHQPPIRETRHSRVLFDNTMPTTGRDGANLDSSLKPMWSTQRLRNAFTLSAACSTNSPSAINWQRYISTSAAGWLSHLMLIYSSCFPRNSSLLATFTTRIPSGSTVTLIASGNPSNQPLSGPAPLIRADTVLSTEPIQPSSPHPHHLMFVSLSI